MNVSERAAACKGWRWIDGIRYREPERFAPGHWVRVGPRLTSADRPSPYAVPDLDDPATLGCIEHDLLPAAGYGPDVHLSASSDSKGQARWYVVYRPDPVSFPGQWLSACEDGSSSKAEALVVALEVE